MVSGGSVVDCQYILRQWKVVVLHVLMEYTLKVVCGGLAAPLESYAVTPVTHRLLHNIRRLCF